MSVRTLSDKIRGGSPQAGRRAPDEILAPVAGEGGPNPRRPARIAGLPRRFFIVSVSVATVAILAVFSPIVRPSPDAGNGGGQTFLVEKLGIGLSARNSPPIGTDPSAPVEMSPAMPEATTRMRPGDWFYSVRFTERAPASSLAACAAADLVVNGESAGIFYFCDLSPDAASIEGVTLRWSLGSDLSPSASFVLRLAAA